MSDDRRDVGLCADCRHARVQETARGSRFWRCLRAESDERFLRYPALPVRVCVGHEASGVDHLFVYGTLLPEHAPAALAPTIARLRELGGGSVPGRLYDFGAYPGAILDPAATTRVSGRVFVLPDDPEVLAKMDAYEGFAAGNPGGSVFRRMRTVVALSDGGTTEAWVYEYNRDPGAAPVIAGGRFDPRSR